MLNHKYQSALDYLYSFVDYSLTRNLRYSPDKFNLGRMRSLLELIGNPEKKYPIIHVAGTKGKGSICAFIASILKTGGYKVGLYTSPHMHNFSERISINGHNISQNDLVSIIEEMKPNIDKIEKLTTFEITTASAFLYFSRKKVDIAVIEVGLGGRLDATNIVVPIISVISSISKDHVKILGNNLKKITYEKSGIIKLKIPVVVAPQKPQVLQIIKQVANKNKSPIYVVDDLYLYRSVYHDLERQIFELIRTENKILKNQFEIPLLGFHQIQNAVAVYATIEILNKEGYKISPANISSGFKNVHWEGRFEILGEKPLLIIDSAHNVDSIRKLFRTINEYLTNKKVILVFGVSEDKDASGMIQVFKSRIDNFIATESDHPRSLEVSKIISIAEKNGLKGEAIIPIESALQKAIQFWDENSVIIATGSIFIATAVKEVWNKSRSM